jgi:hypothetical protein
MSSDDDALERFWAAVEDPSPASMEVAQDIALEQGWKLWKLGEDRGELEFDPEGILRYASLGTFYYRDAEGYYNGGEWRISEVLGGSPRYRVELRYEILGHDREIILPWRALTLGQARIIAALNLWHAVKTMKQGQAEGWDVMDIFSVTYRDDLVSEGMPPELNPPQPMDPKEAFWAAVADPDEASTEIAQDIALGQGWKLWELGEEYANELRERSTRYGAVVPLHFGADNDTRSQGAFYMKPGVGVEWVVDVGQYGRTQRGKEAIWASTFVIYHGYEASSRLSKYPGVAKAAATNAWKNVEEARAESALTAWRILATLKEAYRKRWDTDKFANAMLMHRDRVPAELNPMSKNPDDLAAARDKYKEFHRYDPKDVGEFPSSFTIPKRMLLAGKGKWVTYRSSKIDPSTLEKPRRPIDYIHEHDAGVMTYINDDDADTDVPDKFRDVTALVKLGECLGFCVIDGDGEEVEAEGTSPLPELYTTPDGKCLFVIQGKREVLAMTWGGALGVFARGIDG